MLTGIDVSGNMSKRIVTHIAPMTGSSVRKVRSSPRGVLIIDSGEPMVMPTYVRGEWRLGVFNSAWRLEGPAGPLVGSGDEPRRVAEAVQALRGAPLSHSAVEGPQLNAVFTFGELRLRLFQLYTGPDKQSDAWAVWTPDRRQVRIGPGCQVRIDSELGDNDGERQ